MMFVISPIVLELDYIGQDERLKLYNLLCDKNSKLKELQGKKTSIPNRKYR